MPSAVLQQAKANRPAQKGICQIKSGMSVRGYVIPGVPVFYEMSVVEHAGWEKDTKNIHEVELDLLRQRVYGLAFTNLIQLSKESYGHSSPALPQNACKSYCKINYLLAFLLHAFHQKNSSTNESVFFFFLSFEVNFLVFWVWDF